MSALSFRQHARGLAVSLVVFFCLPLDAAQWSIPLAGNSFRTAPSPGGQFAADGSLVCRDTAETYSVYFHVDRPAQLQLSLVGRAPQGPATITVAIDGIEWTRTIDHTQSKPVPLGDVTVADSGYMRVTVQCQPEQPSRHVELQQLIVASDTVGLNLDYVKNNDGNMFYWGRRGPSVHLRYDVPSDHDLRYAYSELTVPVGQDPIGSYFMANGFSQGYFGMQVNGPAERRILFSVWSPFQTDDPEEIPVEQRIKLLGKGDAVQVGQFGNEGSGGQSYLVYPWQSGQTYRFLTEVRPDGQGSTIYTAWFAQPDAERWRLIASFRRPQTDTHLSGFHSFLENFNPVMGHLPRQIHYSNVWVADVRGRWHECTTARFSVDATGGGRHRLDFTGGAQESSFYLRNGGFVAGTVPAGQSFRRRSTAAAKPEIDFQMLPRD